MAVLGVGIVFLAAAGFWAWVALEGREDAEPSVRVRVRVLDEAGKALGRAQVRSRYGGTWVDCDANGVALLGDPRTKAGVAETTEALADAIEARAVSHAARRGTRAVVTAGEPGAFEAEIRLAHCGILRLGVAPAGLPGARARVDPDPTGRRWQLAEGHDVIRAGEAASYVTFEGAGEIWVTLEGDRGVAQSRVKIEAPGPGMRVEKSLSPGPAAPIRGRVALPDGAWVPTLAGRLEVLELEPQGGEHIRRLPVRVEADGTFLVDYVAHGRYELTAHLPFASVLLPVGAAGGDDQVLISAQPRPWIELGPVDLARLVPPPRVSLFAGDDPADLLGGADAVVVPVPQGLAVPCPGAGTYRVVLHQRGTDDSPPKSGRAEVAVGGEGPAPASVALSVLPSAGLILSVPSVPERGGTVRVLPDRERTLLPKVATEAQFRYLPAGPATVWIVWNDDASAQDWLELTLIEGATQKLVLEPRPGVPLRLDVRGTVVEHDARAWTLRFVPGATPYEGADARLPLDREGGGPVLKLRGGLRPGAYRAVLEPQGTAQGPKVELAFTLAPGDTAPVRIAPP
jgi:hypothetical protein